MAEERIFGRKWLVVSTLGVGGMGTVYEVEHVSLRGLRRALKHLRTEFGDRADVRRRFAREAQAMAQLSHPNIVAIHDVDVDEDLGSFIVMDLVRGADLRRTIAEKGRLTYADTLRIGLEITSALVFAHARGVVHRDLKPGNIIIEEGTGRSVLTDFGIAKLLESDDDDDATQTQFFVGTIRYASPEQLRNEEVDPRSDVYSLGAVFYESCSGQRYLHELKENELTARLLGAVPDWKPELDFPVDVPEGFRSLVRGCLALDRGQRIQSASEVLLRLHDCNHAVLAAPRQAAAVVVAPHVPIDSALPTAARANDDLDATLTAAISPETVRFLQEGPREAVTPALDATAIVAGPNRGQAAQAIPVALTVLSSRDATQVGMKVAIAHSPFAVGRAASADLVIAADEAISRRHLEIATEEKGYVLRDLGGKNEVFLDGRPVPTNAPVPLHFGATIVLSRSTSLRFLADLPLLPDLTGHVLEGRYELTKLLHAGMKAATYAARDRRLPRTVAAKVFSPVLTRLQRYLDEYQRQVEVAAGLDHPHICKILDSGATRVDIDGRAQPLPYLCMQLMDGGNLMDRLEQMPTPPFDVTIRWLEELCSALAYAHRHGVVHGDLKPNSIVFDAEGIPYLTDFALAGSANAPPPQAVLGAPPFLAPEQWEGQPASAASDQYALGVLAYLMISGARPYEGQELPEVRRRNFQHGPPPLDEEARRNQRDGIPSSLNPVLAKALSISPHDRYAGVANFFGALKAALGTRAHSKDEPRVFLSYRRESSAGWANLFARELLDRHRISTFVDTQKRDSAGEFPAKLARAIADCDVFVCLLDADTLTSDWVCEEIRLAVTHGKPMVPVFQEGFPENTQPEAEHLRLLLRFDGVHLLDRLNIHVDHTIDDLAGLIRSTLS